MHFPGTVKSQNMEMGQQAKTSTMKPVINQAVLMPIITEVNVLKLGVVNRRR